MLVCIICQNEVTSDADRCQFCGSTDFIKVVSKKNDVKEKAAKSGFLNKQGGAIKSWKKRFFVLTQDGNLEYYMNDQLNTKQLYEQMGSVKVDGALVLLIERGVFDDRDGYLFALTPEKGKSVKETEIRQYVLEAPTEAVRTSWIETLMRFGAVDGGEVGFDRLNPDSIYEGTLTMFVKSPFAFIGTLTKKTIKKDMISNIKKRYCVLTVNELICYKTKQEAEAVQRLTITQDSKCAGIDDKEAHDIGFDKPVSFSVIEKAGDKPVYFSCRDETEKNDWLAAISSVISGNALIRIRKKTIAEALLEDAGASPQVDPKRLVDSSSASSTTSFTSSSSAIDQLYDDIKEEPKKKCSVPNCTGHAQDGRDMCVKHANEALALNSQSSVPVPGKKKKLLVVDDPNAKSSLSPAVSPAVSPQHKP